MARLIAFAVVVLGIGSCGGGNGNGAAPDLSPAAKAKWDEYCAARLACQPTSMCPSVACTAGFAESEPLIEFVDCQNAKACGANDDDCIAAAGTTDAEREAFIPRCEAALRAYQAMPQSVPPVCYVDTPICAIVAAPLVRKQIMHAVDACLTVACKDLQPCLDAALAPLDCW